MTVRWVWFGVALTLFGCADRSEPASQVAVQPQLLLAFDASDDMQPVIVGLREPSATYADRDARRATIAQLQAAVLDNLRGGFALGRRFAHVPAFSGRLHKSALASLMADPNVAYVQLDGRGGGQLKVAVPAIGGDKVKSMYGITGKGITVAVLDTGVDTTHPDLKDAIVAQHCFTQGDCPPLRSAEGTSAEDDHGHGSNVAGIIASRGVVAGPGFAPDAKLVAVKVDDENDSGVESDWIAGMDWVYDNLAMLNVKLVNISIGTNALYTTEADCDAAEPGLAAAVKNLVDAGVAVFAASGNRGSSTQLSAPACLTGVIAVGATYDANVGHQPPNSLSYAARWGSAFASCADDTTMFDEITCFTNSNARLDLVAPGAPITSDSLQGQTEMYWGTSQACPAATGVAALMLQCNAALKPSEIRDAMRKSGVPITDPKNNMMFPSLRALAAVQAVCFQGDAGVAGGGAGVAGAAGLGGTGAAVAGRPAMSAAMGGSSGQGMIGMGANASGTPTAAGSAGMLAAGRTGAAPTAAGVAAGASGSATGQGRAGATALAGAGALTAAPADSTPQTSSGCSCSSVGRAPLPARLPISFALGVWLLVGTRLTRRGRKSSRNQLVAFGSKCEVS